MIPCRFRLYRWSFQFRLSFARFLLFWSFFFCFGRCYFPRLLLFAARLGFSDDSFLRSLFPPLMLLLLPCLLSFLSFCCCCCPSGPSSAAVAFRFVASSFFDPVSPSSSVVSAAIAVFSLSGVALFLRPKLVLLLFCVVVCPFCFPAVRSFVVVCPPLRVPHPIPSLPTPALLAALLVVLQVWFLFLLLPPRFCLWRVWVFLHPFLRPLRLLLLLLLLSCL